MANNYMFTLTDPVSHEKGLYRGTTNSTRAERADIFEMLLRDKVLAISFFLKNSLAAGQTRLAICTRNDCWIKYDVAEQIRKDNRDARITISDKPAPAARPAPNIYTTGVIPIYDIIKGNWISFDVDNVESIRGVISPDIDAVWDIRKRWGRIGLSCIPADEAI